VFGCTYSFNAIRRRYFNVFGRRQEPEDAYLAVTPKWISTMLNNQPDYINGDGEAGRDFRFIDNDVQVTPLVETLINEKEIVRVFNVAVGDHTNLNPLYSYLPDNLMTRLPKLKYTNPAYRDFRACDARYESAVNTMAKALIGYEVANNVKDGLKEAMAWYLGFFGSVEPMVNK
jgi:UDP-N-acetylglucosamine 4-epimerase